MHKQHFPFKPHSLVASGESPVRLECRLNRASLNWQRKHNYHSQGGIHEMQPHLPPTVWHLLLYDVDLWGLKTGNQEASSAYGQISMDSDFPGFGNIRYIVIV